MPSEKHVRCTLCGLVLPGWLRLPNHPNSAMLLHHLGTRHLGVCRPYLERMETECIDTVLLEVFERVEAPTSRCPHGRTPRPT